MTKAYYVKSFDEKDDEAKAPTRQITEHKDLLSSSELDESVTNTFETRQMQQAEFVAAVYRKCSRHQACEQADDPREATIQFHSCVRGDVHCWRRRRNVGSSESQDIMTKYNEVNCVDNLTWCETHGGARELDGSDCTGSVQW